MSQRYTLDKTDRKDLLKVLLWTVASAIVAGVLGWLEVLPVEMQQAIWFPIVNTGLVALKRFFEDKLN